MKVNKQTTQYILDFSDIEDISGNESEKSSISDHLQPSPPPPPPPPQEPVPSLLQVKREGVDMPQIAIQPEEEAPQKRKIDIQDQYWQINFEDLDEQEQVSDLQSPNPIEINKDPSPPPIQLEEPQYIEQYFEDQNIIEEIDFGEEQLKQEKQKEQNKNDFITKKQLASQEMAKQQSQNKQSNPLVTTTKQASTNEVYNPNRSLQKQKFYNPKNSLIYLRLKGREDLYKKCEPIQDEQPQVQPERDELLEGLDCINSLLIGLSSTKEQKKQQQSQEKQKLIPLQIQKHRLDEKGEHFKEKKATKRDDTEAELQREKEKQEKLKLKEAKQNESAQKQQQHQEAALARQIRHEQLQQQKQLLKLLNQRQVYQITTKKLVSSGLALYRCCLKEKQRDFVQWLRFSEIALINKGEDEIFLFEKRLSDQMFMKSNKQNMNSVRITKNILFDKVFIPYIEEENDDNKKISQRKDKSKKQDNDELVRNHLKEVSKNHEKKENRNKEKEKNQSIEIENEKHEDHRLKEKQKQKQLEKQKELQKEKQNEKDEDEEEIAKRNKRKENENSLEKDNQVRNEKKEKRPSQDKLETVVTKHQLQMDQKKTNQKTKCFDSDEGEYDNELLDADKIKIFKVNNERQRKTEKKDQKLPLTEQKYIEKPNEKEIINEKATEQKKNKFHRFRQQGIVLSRLETNDKLKKLQKINEKRQEKRKKVYLQQLEQQNEQQADDRASTDKNLTKEEKKIRKQKQPKAETNIPNSSIERKQQNASLQRQQQQKNELEAQKQNGLSNQKKKKQEQQSGKGGQFKMTTRSVRPHNTRSGNTSSMSRSLPRATEVEPGYISTRRVYESKELNKRRRRVIEDEDFEASQEGKRQQPIKQIKKK